MPDVPLPPGPETPAWEQARAWIETPLEFWRACHATYGDTFTVQLGSLGPTVLFCDPQAIQVIFGLHRDQYGCGEYNEHYGLLMGARSLLVLDGEAHWMQRRMVAPSLSGTSVTRWIDRIRARATPHLESLDAGASFSPRRWVQAIVLDNMLQLLFGAGHSELASLLRNVMLREVSKDYGTWSPWSRFTKWHPVFRQQIAREVAAMRRGDLIDADLADADLADADPTDATGGKRPPIAVGECLFDRLVQQRNDDGQWLEVEQIQDHVFTLVLAGVDPTMLSTTWALHWVWNAPELVDRLRRELPNEADLSTWIQESELLEATVREVLRMVPVVTTPSGRKLRQQTQILDRVYPAGTTLVPCTYLVHRRAALYPQPDQFRPERFLERTYKTYEYFPFGGGQRVCPGARLAQLTIKTILAELLARFELQSATEGPVVAVRHGTLLAPSDNLQLRVGTRLAASSLRG